MSVTDAWTDPSEGGSLDCDAGSVLTDAKWDGVCSDLLKLGGSNGLRGKYRQVWVPVHSVSGTSAAFYGQLAPYAACTAADGQADSFYANIMVPADYSALTALGVVVICDGTGNLYHRFDLQYAAWGMTSAAAELRTNHDPGAESYRTLAVVQGDMMLLPASAASTGAIAPGDVVGIRWDRDGSHASDTVGGSVYVLGFALIYQTA